MRAALLLAAVIIAEAIRPGFKTTNRVIWVYAGWTIVFAWMDIAELMGVLGVLK